LGLRGGRRKRDGDLAELVRDELAAVRDEVRSGLGETAVLLSVQLRTELNQRVGEPTALTAGIEAACGTIAERNAELVRALERVVDACDALSQRVQIDRIERAALVDAIGRLTTALAVSGTVPLPSAPPGPHSAVIGGTVDPSHLAASETIPARNEPIETTPLPAAATGAGPSDDEIDLEAEERAPEPPGRPRGRSARTDGVEVRCRFGDRWVTGFEVCEVITLDDAIRYRLRRRSDGSVLPTLFDQKDLRFFTTTFLDPT
jgi:hypothetical protein